MALSFANRILFPIALGALALRTLAGDQPLIDGVEFAIASHTLGIPHPSGYPLFCTLAHLGSLLPLGNVAYKTAFMSGVFALAATLLGEGMLRGALRAPALSPVYGMLLGTMGLLWSQGLAAEVYSLHMLILLACCWALWRWGGDGDRRWGYLFALLLGLALSNHHLTLVAMPGFGWMCLVGVAAERKRGRLTTGIEWSRLFLVGALLFTVGLSGNLYLPLRSAQNPPIDRGNPENAKGLSEMLLKRVSSSTKDTGANSTQNLRFHLHRAAEIAPGQMPLALLAFAPLGLWVGFRRWPARFGGLAIVCGVTTFMAMWSFYSRSQEIAYLVDPFLLTGFLGLFALCALGVDWMIDRAGREPRGLWLQGACAVALGLLAAGQVVRNFAPNDRSQERTAGQWSRDILNELPRDAVLVAFVDELFPLSYAQIIEKRRPDARPMHQVSLLYAPDTWPQTIPKGVEMVYPPQGQAPRGEEAAIYQQAVRSYFAQEDRPLLTTGFARALLPEGYELAVQGLSYRLQPRGAEWPEAFALAARWERVDFRPLGVARLSRAEAERNFHARYVGGLNNTAGYLGLGLGLVGPAGQLLQRSEAIAPGNRGAPHLRQRLGLPPGVATSLETP